MTTGAHLDRKPSMAFDRLTDLEVLELQLITKRDHEKAVKAWLGLHKGTFDAVVSGGRCKAHVIARVRQRMQDARNSKGGA